MTVSANDNLNNRSNSAIKNEWPVKTTKFFSTAELSK